MATNILMPASGQTSDESVITHWFFKEGDSVKRGDTLFEIETDKATMGVESFASGLILKINHDAGESVAEGTVVAVIGEESELYQPESQTDTGLQASPKARFLARERGLDIAALFTELSRPVLAADIPAEKDEFTLLPLSAMRKTIAKNMLKSAQAVPQYQISASLDMEAFMTLREQLNEKLATEGIKLSVNDLLIKAVCSAIKKTPLINSSYTEDGILLYKQINVGLAVALEEGLIVPVIQDAGGLSIKAIALITSELVALAKQGKLDANQMRGGTITISNLGMFGIDRFTALLNPPESAILAVGNIIATPVARDGKVVIRPMMDITASFDHRIIDGAVGARFVAAIREIIETPRLLPLNL